MMSVDMNVAEVFSHFIGEILTLIDSTPISKEKQIHLKRLVERRMYNARNMIMDGFDNKIIDGMKEEIESYSSVALYPKELSESFNKAVLICIKDLRKGLEKR